MGSSQLKAAGA
ncbi:hypothetical protein HaLaN_31682, partial [Haematococcus lacustris]